MAFDLSKAVTGRAQDFGQLNSFGSDNRYHLVAKGQSLLNGYAQVSPAGEAQPIGQSINRVIHIQQDLGNRADVHNRLAETQDSRERAPTLHYGDRADSVQRHMVIRASTMSQNVMNTVVFIEDLTQLGILLMRAEAEVSNIQRLIPFRGLTP